MARSGLSQSEYSRRYGLKMAIFNCWVLHMVAKGECLLFHLGVGLLPVQIE
jgi:hypothetical protein